MECRLTFLFLLPLSNLFRCFCHVLLYSKTTQTSLFFFNLINYILTSFTTLYSCFYNYTFFRFNVNKLFLPGPRGALIFFRRGERKVGKKTIDLSDIEEKINFSVFPGLQGGPHNHTITALATALKQAASPDFVDYQKAVSIKYRKAKRERACIAYMDVVEMYIPPPSNVLHCRRLVLL